MNESKTYRSSPIQFIVLLLAALLFGGLLLPLAWRGDQYVFLLLAIPVGALLALAFFSMTSEIVVSETEIVARRFWAVRSLTWSEIHRVSGTGGGIKLQNFDEDVTVSLNQQLTGFEEVLEKVAQKRPDLFAAPELQEIGRNPLFLAMQIFFGVAIPGFAIWAFTELAGDAWPSLLFSFVFGLYFLGTALLSVHAISIEGNSLLVKHLYKEASYRADEIETVALNFHRTRNGRVYYVQIALKDGKKIRVSNMRGGAPLVYLVLREWHRKNTAGKLSV